MLEFMLTKSWNGLGFGVSQRFVRDMLGKPTFHLRARDIETVVQMNFGSLELIFDADRLYAISVDFASWKGLPPGFGVVEWLRKPTTAPQLLANFQKRGLILRENRNWSRGDWRVFDFATWCHIWCADAGGGILTLSKIDCSCQAILRDA